MMLRELRLMSSSFMRSNRRGTGQISLISFESFPGRRPVTGFYSQEPVREQSTSMAVGISAREYRLAAAGYSLA
jgi:hypothetical protein